MRDELTGDIGGLLFPGVSRSQGLGTPRETVGSDLLKSDSVKSILGWSKPGYTPSPLNLRARKQRTS